ncbi:STAS domain-containing protein [Streptomyces sp. NPDC006307]|uniref:STAS domain-containing protein n=1 Tax=Streptomyces sp. NPDC006307 TaxID=3156748 RepID=UPI0033BDD87F
MDEFLCVIAMLPSAMFTASLVVVTGFWLLVPLGMADRDTFGTDVNTDEFGLGGAPVSVTASLLIASSWFLSVTASILLARTGWPEALVHMLGATLLLASLFGSWRVTRGLVRPLAEVFPSKAVEAAERAAVHRASEELTAAEARHEAADRDARATMRSAEGPQGEAVAPKLWAAEVRPPWPGGLHAQPADRPGHRHHARYASTPVAEAPARPTCGPPGRRSLPMTHRLRTGVPGSLVGKTVTPALEPPDAALATSAKVASMTRLLRGTPSAPDAVVVTLRGQIDARNVGRAIRTLLDALHASPTTLRIDLSGVEHLSADGAGAFLAGLRAARSRGTHLKVTNASPQVAKMLARVGLRGILSAGEGRDSPDA